MSWLSSASPFDSLASSGEDEDLMEDFIEFTHEGEAGGGERGAPSQMKSSWKARSLPGGPSPKVGELAPFRHQRVQERPRAAARRKNNVVGLERLHEEEAEGDNHNGTREFQTKKTQFFKAKLVHARRKGRTWRSPRGTLYSIDDKGRQPMR